MVQGIGIVLNISGVIAHIITHVDHINWKIIGRMVIDVFGLLLAGVLIRTNAQVYL